MNKTDRLTRLVSDADKAYQQSVIEILDEVIPGLNMKLKQNISGAICWGRDKYGDIDELVLMEDGKAFKNPALADILAERIQKIRKENEDMGPSIDKHYWCETCGSHSHECSPLTGYCFNCNTDNWKRENY